MKTANLSCFSLGLFTLSLSATASEYADVTDVKLKTLATQTFTALEDKQNNGAPSSPFIRPGSAVPTEDPVVQISSKSRDGKWMLGSVTEMLPDSQEGAPDSRHFLAKNTNGEWSIGMVGDEDFYDLLRSAPDEVVGAALRQVLVQQMAADLPGGEAPPVQSGSGANDDADTGLGLPYAIGAAWFSAGIHGDSGESRPYNSIDFDGGDGRVLAPADGVFQLTCKRGRSALVHLTHDNGLKTTYYHMTNLADIREGEKVEQGTYLGRIGNELPCGGRSSGAHVHFSLLQGARQIPVNNRKFGGWTFREGGRAYSGSAVRAGRRINLPGGTLVNDGPSGNIPPVRTDAKGTVRWQTGANIRQSPSLSAELVRTAPKGEVLSLKCYAEGDYFNGLWGRTNLWYQLVSGGWVSDGTLFTGKNTAITPKC